MILLVALILMPVTTAWRGVVGAVLWGWYVAPITGLPPIGFAAAIGLSCAVAMFTPTPPPPVTRDEEDRDRAQLNSIVVSFLLPAFALAIGWFVLPYAGVS